MKDALHVRRCGPGPIPVHRPDPFKKRPAVVASSEAYNVARSDLVVMAITSQMRATARLGEVFVKAWHGAGLLKPSAIKPVIATIERRLVIRRLGTLGSDDQTALKQALSEILG